MAKDKTLFVQIYLSGNWLNSCATLLLVIAFSKSMQSGSTMIPPIQSIFHIVLSDQEHAKLHFEPPKKAWSICQHDILTSQPAPRTCNSLLSTLNQ